MATNPATESAAQPEFHFGPPVVTPRGDGGFVVAPPRLIAGVEEVGWAEAAEILGYKARSSIHEEVLNHPLAEQYLRWRYTPGGGKILFQKPSLFAFKEATSRPAEK